MCVYRRSVVFIPDANVESDPSAGLPVVLEEAIDRMRAKRLKIIVLGQETESRKTKQEFGKSITSQEAAKTDLSAGKQVGVTIRQIAADFEAGFHVVPAKLKTEAIRKMQRFSVPEDR